MFPLTVPRLHAVMPNAPLSTLATWIGPLEQAMAKYAIVTPARAQMFLAQIAHESTELTQLEENLRYSARALRRVFTKYFADDAIAAKYAARGPEAIANRVYANRLENGSEASGDGWKFRGRSPICVTFRGNYRACSIALLNDPTALTAHPDRLKDAELGAVAAGWYWDSHRCNDFADRGDFDGVCDQVNLGRKTLAVGDSIGFADRVTYWKRAIGAGV